MIFGGFSISRDSYPLPVGAEPVTAGRPAWKLGDGPIRMVAAQGGRRRVLILGWCGVGRFELRCLAESRLPDDIAWRWPGTYAVAEETEDSVTVYTDPAAACPVYLAAHRGGWAWCTSARVLAALSRAALDTQRLVCSVLLPSLPALAGSRTFFEGVQQLPPGSRVELPADGSLHCTTLWRPDPGPIGPPAQRLRETLASAVALRATADPELSCDLSGGLDSTSVAVLAVTALPTANCLDAVTIHPEGDQSGADLAYARLTANAHPGRIAHHLLPMAAEHLPYSHVTAVPSTDEPAPSTLTQARLTGQLHWMRKELGARTHLTGDGGDSVLFQPPIHLVISASPDPVLWIASHTCALGPYRADLVETYWRWEQDPALLVGYGRQSPESLEARTEGMVHQLRGENLRFTVYDLTTGAPVPSGVATLLPDHAVRTAEYVVMLAPEARGRGLGTEATRLTLDYAFHITNLRMVWLKVLAPNKAAVLAYEKAGFRTVGALREAGYWLGRVCDEIVMDALPADFPGPSVITPLLP